MSIASTYSAAQVVSTKKARKQRQHLAVPVTVETRMKEFHGALLQYAPRVAGERPSRLPYIRDNGSNVFEDAKSVTWALKAAQIAAKALGFNVTLEASPVPNPNGGSPLYQILGYLNAERPRNSRSEYMEVGQQLL